MNAIVEAESLSRFYGVILGLNNVSFTIRPGTSEVWSGDVGWNTWEEINRLGSPIDSVIDNFGWPCYEGPDRESSYDAANLNICENLYTAGPSAWVAPFASLPRPGSLNTMPAALRMLNQPSSALGFTVTRSS